MTQGKSYLPQKEKINSGGVLSPSTPPRPEEEPPSAGISRVIFVGIALIALVFGGIGIWAATAEITAAVIAAGEVKVDSNRQTIQHLEGGIVKEILVQNGDQVRRGDVLVRLEGEQVVATVDLLRGQKNHLLALKARLEAERDLARSISWPDELTGLSGESQVREVMEGERKIFHSRLQTIDNEIMLVKAQLEQLNLRVGSLGGAD